MRKAKALTSQRIIIAGFLIMIISGALLLMLPISSNGKTGFVDALFTATSASCVTGLVAFDTASYWTVFGKAVIILLIQIGGMGVVTMAVLITKLSGKRIGVFGRSLMQDSISAQSMGGILKLTGFIIKTAFATELLGALVLMFPFISRYGAVTGIGYSLFHSVSAFCNAGFDIIGGKPQFSSLCGYTDNVTVNTVICLLIIIGGIGFLSWDDIKKHKFRFKKYRMQTKVVLTWTLVLIILPALFLFFFEFNKLPMKSRVLGSVFQSVTLRTAGFNTLPLDSLSDSSKLVMIFMMLTGGSPGSTAGGMKITTVAVMLASAVSVFKRKKESGLFGRRIEDNTVKTAAAVFVMYIALFLTGGVIISMFEGLPLTDCLFETASAIGTVGLTVGITPSLSVFSKLILTALMFFGRVGGLTLIFAAFSGSESETKLPSENIIVG